MFYLLSLVLLITHSINHSFKIKCGSSSVGRAIAFQAIGREFEPRLPLKDMSDFEFSISDLKIRVRQMTRN